MEEQALFKLVQDEDGKWWRHCLASQVCIEKSQRFEKRVDMKRHLETKHACTNIVLPPLPMGRPKVQERPTKSKSDRSRIQSEARFYNEELKAKNARKAHEKSKIKEGECRWNLLKEKTGSKEEWVHNYVKIRMATWDSRNESRRKLVQERVTEGYEKWRRNCTAKTDVPDVEEKDVPDVEEETKEEPETPQMETSPVEDPPLAPHKLRVKRRRTLDMSLPSGSRHSKEDIIHECQQPKFSNAKEDAHVDIKVCSGSFDCKSPGPEAFAESGGVVFHMKSTRFKLAVDLHASIVEDTINVEASTNTMNVFALWMENTLSVNVLEQTWFVDSLWRAFLGRKQKNENTMANFLGTPDLGRKVFTFFPVIDRSHWTLLVLYNPHSMRLPSLPRRRSCILSFDSLGMRSSQKYYDYLYRTLVHFGSFCSDPIVKMELLNPAEEIGCESYEIPQQPNAYDCGFYVMTVMWFLIKGGLDGCLPKTWLSKRWFKHEDVDRLKKNLFEWIQNVVERVPMSNSP